MSEVKTYEGNDRKNQYFGRAESNAKLTLGKKDYYVVFSDDPIGQSEESAVLCGDDFELRIEAKDYSMEEHEDVLCGDEEAKIWIVRK